MIDPSSAGLFPLNSGKPDRTLLWDDNSQRWQTERELRAQILELAAHLEAPEKQLVFLLAHNRADVLAALLAAAAAGHAVALIDPNLAADRIENLLTCYRPDVVIGLNEVEWMRGTAHSSANWQTSQVSRLTFAHRKDRGASLQIAPELLLLLLTSGTTGSSKFVRLSGNAVAANARQIASSLSLDDESVAIAHLPLHYSYGLSVVTSHLAAGGRIAMLDDSVTSPTFWSKVDACGGTHFPGVPFHYTVLARLGFNVVPSSIDTFTQAGGHLDTRIQKSILEKAAERNARSFVMYGQTEAAPRMTTLPHDKLHGKLGSVGIAMPGGKVSVVDLDGNTLPADATGAIVYEGPNVMMGYAEGRDDLSAGDTSHGRLETGDLGWLDSEGYLFLSGRAARFAKIAGLRLSLDDIEKAIAHLGPAACIDRGERIIVGFENVVPNGAKEEIKAIAQACKIPSTSFALRAWPGIPRKSNGKIDYAKVRELADV